MTSILTYDWDGKIRVENLPEIIFFGIAIVVLSPIFLLVWLVIKIGEIVIFDFNK